MAHLRIAPSTDRPLPFGGHVHFHPCADCGAIEIVCFAADGCDATAYVCPACQSAREDWESQFVARTARRG
jgi:predicted RNA-binding Zn-ribbon protein involved in translation (DUF1610 family)